MAQLLFVAHQLYLDDVRDTDTCHHAKGERFDELRRWVIEGRVTWVEVRWD